MSYVLTDIQAGAVGTQACSDACNAIAGIIGDLETTAMFCTAGALPGSGGKYVVLHFFALALYYWIMIAT